MGTGDTFVNPREDNALWSGTEPRAALRVLRKQGDTPCVWDGDKGQRVESPLEEERLVSESARKTGAECPEIGGPRGLRCEKE